ncbi:deaminase [Leptospira bourretii]|uniref:Riboflavin biosynthesis protein RibD n=1 Tax=Leptospira bourretii TaxID=2484962 RepID=A0A4R9IM88_9LEPT|nr:dihydrofolate reductase family protein [Leptospira bourretii]TGK84967.1 deaminase [Leptospira bourretii]TGK90732.1 deaminase [Leptospira bourretii]TGL35875.1 deaminase [Leptospira bourretii]
MNAEKRKETYSLHSLLGFLAMGKTGANPPVSAVLTDETGSILASAHTQKFGGYHAERELYSRYPNTGENQVLSVSLEPCTHFGKTPPCRDLVIEKKPKEIKLGWKDPNPLVSSGDWEKYAESGISVTLDPMLAKVSLPFLQGFLHRIKTGRPWVWIKAATSIEGNYASKEKRKERVSSEEMDLYLQVFRAKMDAIAVGPGTVFVDSPSLHFRITEEMVLTQKPGIRVTELEPFFEAGAGLISSLLSYTKDSEKLHRLEEEVYQPFRIFCLDENRLPSETFFAKQRELTEKFGVKKCIFFILTEDDSKPIAKELEEQIKILSPYEGILIYSDEGDKFLEILGELGINTLLCEAGSFFPNFLQNELSEEDRVLEIRNEKKSIPNGIPFVYHNEPLISEYQVGSNRIFIRKPQRSI